MCVSVCCMHRGFLSGSFTSNMCKLFVQYMEVLRLKLSLLLSKTNKSHNWISAMLSFVYFVLENKLNVLGTALALTLLVVWRKCSGGGYTRAISFYPDDSHTNLHHCVNFFIHSQKRGQKLLCDLIISIHGCRYLDLRNSSHSPVNVSPVLEHLFDHKHIEYS